MKFKIDENIQGASDNALRDICVTENRVLITLDLDFSNIPRYHCFAIIQNGQNIRFIYLEK